MKNQIRISLLAAVALSMAACGKTTTAPSSAAVQSPTPVYVCAECGRYYGRRSEEHIRLVKVNPQTLYFTDRPQRIAGHIKMPAYFAEWTRAAARQFQQ